MRNDNRAGPRPPIRHAIGAAWPLKVLLPGLVWLTASQAETIQGTAVRDNTVVTRSKQNHILTNIGVWSPDSRWIYYDIRSDLAGSVFDGRRIERVEVATGQVERIYESERGAHCGVVTCSPTNDRVVFIHGPEDPTDDWQYAAWHRRGVLVEAGHPETATTLDARDLVPPFTPGALRGGSHVHVFSGDGLWVSFTYEDHVLQTGALPVGTLEPGDDRPVESNQRNVGVTQLGHPVRVPARHPRNHNGAGFSVLVTRTVDAPRAGSDEIDRAYSDAWVGKHGYVRADGSRQPYAIAFLGNVRTSDGRELPELFLVDLPSDLTAPGDRPLEGTATTRPGPPAGTRQRRLTFTHDRRYPGIQGPRHWPRSSPDGRQIAFLMKDDQGVPQLWSISPLGDSLCQLTHNPFGVESAFSWSPDGREIAFIGNQSVCVVTVEDGQTLPLTPRVGDAAQAPRTEACVFSPDGTRIAYVCPQRDGSIWRNQIHVVDRHAKE